MGIKTTAAAKMYSHNQPIYLDLDLSDYEPRYQLPPTAAYTIPYTPQRQRKTNRASALIPNNHYVSLEGFSPENIRITMNKRGKVRVRANKEAIIDMGENGKRKHTESVEQTLELPEYLVELGMLDKVETRFELDNLVFVYPRKPNFARVDIELDSEDEKDDAKDDEKTIVK